MNTLLSSRKLYVSLFSILLVLGTAVSVVADDAVWKPVSKMELAMDKPRVDPDADAEAIFWDIRLDDEKRTKLYYQHYVRVKIFTERGREKFSKFDIPYTKGIKVENVAARVIKPDGSIVELKPSDIFEREIIKRRKLKIKAKSFAVPGIEPGVIVEYQYRERFKGDSLDGERLLFQRDIPLQKVSYHIRPYGKLRLVPVFYNMDETRFIKDRFNKGFLVATKTNVPAFKEEPNMPPDDTVRKWALLKYGGWGAFTWRGFSRSIGIGFEKIIKPNKRIKEKANELAAGAKTDMEKLRIFYEFSQNEIKNLSYDDSPDGRKNTKIKRASDVLKRGMGYPNHINFLFAALAQTLELETNMVFSGNRSVSFFNPRKDIANPSFVHPAGIAVKIDGGWMYFNPGAPYLPFGRLRWYEENVYAMLIGSTGHIWRGLQMSSHKESSIRRKGTFKLLENGTLEGTAIIEYTGHTAINTRRAEFKQSPEKRKENFKEEFRESLSTAEISEIQIENFESLGKPILYSCKVRIPNYAQKTGKRLFFKPGVFRSNSKPVFSSAERVHPIYFRYPWSEYDEIEIELPRNFAVENFSKPNNVLEKSKVGELRYDVDFDKTANELKYKRTFYFGGSGQKVWFPAKAYKPLKTLFDLFHKSDSHSISLRKKPA